MGSNPTVSATKQNRPDSGRFFFVQVETFAKFLSLPTAEIQTQVFGCFRLFPPQIPPNSTQTPP
ncbi:hypothetical protein GC069_11615 [Neisseria meningitidis]|nr:hypothetical protein [Neisseria meningitidis]